MNTLAHYANSTQNTMKYDKTHTPRSNARQTPGPGEAGKGGMQIIQQLGGIHHGRWRAAPHEISAIDRLPSAQNHRRKMGGGEGLGSMGLYEGVGINGVVVLYWHVVVVYVGE
jgi:hypothetical protein